MTNKHISVTCDVVGCDEGASSRYVDAKRDQALVFHVCDRHFARIEGGETPGVVAARLDLADLNGRPTLLMDPD